MANQVLDTLGEWMAGLDAAIPTVQAVRLEGAKTYDALFTDQPAVATPPAVNSVGVPAGASGQPGAVSTGTGTGTGSGGGFGFVGILLALGLAWLLFAKE